MLNAGELLLSNAISRAYIKPASIDENVLTDRFLGLASQCTSALVHVSNVQCSVTVSLSPLFLSGASGLSLHPRDPSEASSQFQ